MNHAIDDAAHRTAGLSAAKRELLERLTGRRPREHAAPSSTLEQRLAAIWSDVLGCQACGVDDNFFRLGGDSILAIRLRTRLFDELGVAIGVEQLYAQPTIRALAAMVAAERLPDAPAAPVAMVSDRADEGLDGLTRPAGVIDVYPMSAMQKGMVFHAELGRHDRSYINHGEALIEGRWSLPAFIAAFDALIRRHEILRTSFDYTTYAEPVQLVHRFQADRMQVPLVDLRGIAADEGRSWRRLRAALSRRLFRLDDFPLLRTVAIIEQDTRHHLAHAHHHAILDGWSLNLLFRELWENYGKAARGVPLQPPTIRTRYREFVQAERAALQSAAATTYWQTTLSGMPKGRFPVAASRGEGTARPPGSPGEATPADRSLSFSLPSAAARALQALAEEEGVHLGTVCLAAHVACMGLLMGQDQVTTAQVVHGRPETADGDVALGLFVNTCLHTVDLLRVTWRELIRRTAATERAAHPHRRYPISRVQELLGQGPAVETLFVFEHYHMHARGPLAAGLRITGSDYAPNDVRLVASVVWHAAREGIDLTLYGQRPAVPAWLLHRVAGWYRRAFDLIAANPEAPVETSALMTRAERHQQIVEWNDTARPLPGRTLLADFEHWVAASPEAPALAAGERTLTYAALNGEANRLAHLIARIAGAPGEGDDGPVAILLEPGEAQVIAVMAIVKAGSAYLPLDASHPADRVRHAVGEARARAVVTTAALRDRFALHDLHGVVVLALDRLQGDLAARPAHNPGIGVADADPLYVIFTSGSTGRPKAVRLNHRGRANNFHDFIRRFRVGPGDGVLAVSNLTFDMSAFDILGTLAAGATVVVPTAAEKKDAHAWVRLMARHRVTVWHSAPALLRMLLDAVPDAEADHLRSLRLVLLGGDWIPLDLPARLAPSIETISLGGATEASMDSTIYRIAGTPFAIPTVPYGRPLDNQQAVVLGPRLQPLPIGVTGELYLGGVGVGDGYVNRPELTACRFLPNPYATTAGERMYKTGDQARHLGDGTLELLGRVDFQVKINGLRIELGEIEKTLLGVPGVEKAIVAARPGADGRPRLVGYIVPARTHAAAGEALVSDIRRIMAARLPAAMQPLWYVPLEMLPLTPNGKVNRLALPDPVYETVTRRAIVEPRSACERTVLETWRSVLRRDAIGVEDDFFEHGGDSVSATQIVSRLRLVFGVDIPLALVFDNPTVAQQAQCLEAQILQASSIPQSPRR